MTFYRFIELEHWLNIVPSLCVVFELINHLPTYRFICGGGGGGGGVICCADKYQFISVCRFFKYEMVKSQLLSGK